MVVVEDVEVGCMACCVANKRKRGWERTLSYLPNLRFQAIRWGCLKGCGGQAQSERERNKRIQTQKRWSRKKGGQNCAAYAALRRGEDGPARGGGQGDFSRNCGWAVQVRGAAVQSIKQNRKDIQKQADTARGSRRSNRPGEFKRLYSAGYALYRRKSMLCGCPV